MYEGGVREPLIVHWPAKITQGSVCNEPITSPDFYPTLLEVAGLDLMPQQHVDGHSFLPLLNGDNNFSRGPIYWHYPHYGNQGGTPGSSIRDGHYKLIEFFEDGRLELYDLKNDLSETRNLSTRKKELTQSMHKMLTDWRQSVDGKIPKVNPDNVVKKTKL